MVPPQGAGVPRRSPGVYEQGNAARRQTAGPVIQGAGLLQPPRPVIRGAALPGPSIQLLQCRAQRRAAPRPAPQAGNILGEEPAIGPGIRPPKTRLPRGRGTRAGNAAHQYEKCVCAWRTRSKMIAKVLSGFRPWQARGPSAKNPVKRELFPASAIKGHRRHMAVFPWEKMALAI